MRMMMIKTFGELVQFIKDVDDDDPSNKKKFGNDYHTPEEKRAVDIENEYVKSVNEKEDKPKQGVRKNHFGSPKKTDSIHSVTPEQ